jgi:Zn-dependent oligopeptidase
LRDTGTVQFSDLLQSTGDNVTHQLKTTATEMAQQMDKSGLEVSQHIEQSGTQISERLLSVSGEFVQNVARARDDLFSYFEDASGRSPASWSRRPALW